MPAVKRLREPDAKRLLAAMDDVFRAFDVPDTRRIGTRRGQESICVGVNRRYSSPVCSVNARLMERPGMHALLQTLHALSTSYFRHFTYTTIQINKNYPGNLHVDRSNAGQSLMFTVGHDLSGGELWCERKVLPTANCGIVFDGNSPHMTLPYRARVRYSIVLFTYAQLCSKGIASGGNDAALRVARALRIKTPKRARSVCNLLRRSKSRGGRPHTPPKKRIQRARSYIVEHLEEILAQAVVPSRSTVLQRVRQSRA